MLDQSTFLQNFGGNIYGVIHSFVLHACLIACFTYSYEGIYAPHKKKGDVLYEYTMKEALFYNEMLFKNENKTRGYNENATYNKISLDVRSVGEVLA